MDDEIMLKLKRKRQIRIVLNHFAIHLYKASEAPCAIISGGVSRVQSHFVSTETIAKTHGYCEQISNRQQAIWKMKICQ